MGLLCWPLLKRSDVGAGLYHLQSAPLSFVVFIDSDFNIDSFSANIAAFSSMNSVLTYKRLMVPHRTRSVMIV